jgi:hypothetical protein
LIDTQFGVFGLSQNGTGTKAVGTVLLPTGMDPKAAGTEQYGVLLRTKKSAMQAYMPTLRIFCFEAKMLTC